MGLIKQFNGKNFFLSNFYETPIDLELDSGTKIHFTSSEAYFQAMKCVDPEDMKQFENLTPDQSKKLGRSITLRPDWEEVKDMIMYAVLVRKFSNPTLAKKLIATYPDELQEGNTWGDRYWGIDIRSGKGENHLGKLLMKLRDQLMLEEKGE